MKILKVRITRMCTSGRCSCPSQIERGSTGDTKAARRVRFLVGEYLHCSHPIANGTAGHALERSWPAIFNCTDLTIIDSCSTNRPELCQCKDGY